MTVFSSEDCMLHCCNCEVNASVEGVMLKLFAYIASDLASEGQKTKDIPGLRNQTCSLLKVLLGR